MISLRTKGLGGVSNMGVYEPELIYALDSKDEYADWRSVYNTKADDIFYCPICLGRVKLWNGQDKNKLYKKQKCFHHIDGMCSQESRIHFAYKHWLLETGSKFKVADNVYEVKESFIEQTLKTKFGNYCPDIIVTTIDNKTFYVEIANTNKKTEEYITKWDELGNDVIEININEQLVATMISKVPEFKMIYSSTTGECYITHLKRNEYVDLIAERKNFWKRENLLEYKIQWERLDWFWHYLQLFYNDRMVLNDLINSFKELNSKDQVFICKRLRGKHLFLKNELEKHYRNIADINKARVRRIDSIIRKVNKDFKFNISNNIHLYRRGNTIFMEVFYMTMDNYTMEINEDINENKLYDYFYFLMKNVYNEHILLREKENECEDDFKLVLDKIERFLKIIEKKFKRCENKLWKIDIYFSDTTINSYDYLCISIKLANYWKYYSRYYINPVKGFTAIKNELVQFIDLKMRDLIKLGKIGNNRFKIIEMEDKKVE